MTKKRVVFVTGTDTDIGKTYICGEIARMLCKSGIKTGYYKAALSGAEFINGELCPRDAEYVKKSSEDPNFNYKVSYVFEEAVSPHLASERSDIEIKMDKIKNDFNEVHSENEFTIVEGSGGIICPISLSGEIIFLEDIIDAIGTDMILVAQSGLGSINSVVLSYEYSKRMKTDIKAVIMNRFENGNIIHEDNKKIIEKITGLPVYKCINEGLDEGIMEILK